MMHARHELDWNDDCRFCGVTHEALEDNIASPNCDVVRQFTSAQTIIPVALGLLITVVLIFGMIGSGY